MPNTTVYNPNRSGSSSPDGGFQRYQPGLGNVGSYQVSGTPWISGSKAGDTTAGQEKLFKFPTVAKAITVHRRDNEGATKPVRVHFAASNTSENVTNGVHYINLNSQDDSITLNIKCSEVYVSSSHANNSYTVIAELTSIPAGEMYALTGAGITDWN